MRYPGYEYIFNSNIDTSNLQDIHIQGKKVDDFHILNKNAIFTMNVGATQELYKIIKEQQETINNLINRIEILERSNQGDTWSRPSIESSHLSSLISDTSDSQCVSRSDPRVHH